MSLEKLITWLIAVVDFFLWNGAGTPVWMYVDFFRLFAYLFFFLLLLLLLLLLLSFLLAKYTGYQSFSSNLAAWSLGIVHHVEALSGVVSVNMADDLMMCVSGAFLLDFSV